MVDSWCKVCYTVHTLTQRRKQMTRDEIFVLALISPIVVIFGCGIAALVVLILKFL